MNGEDHSEDNLQGDNGGLLSAGASAKAYVDFLHSLNTVIDKSSEYLTQTATEKTCLSSGQITGFVIVCIC